MKYSWNLISKIYFSPFANDIRDSGPVRYTGEADGVLADCSLRHLKYIYGFSYQRAWKIFEEAEHVFQNT